MGQLQAYTVADRAPSSEPPFYETTTSTIGTRTVSRPLGSTDQLKSHLRLLGTFALIKQKVEDPSLDPQLAETIPPLAKALPQSRDGFRV